jgi:hypothetical protein
MVLAQANLNPLSAVQEELNKRVHFYADKNQAGNLTTEDSIRWNAYKDALVVVSGLEERSPRKLSQRIDAIMDDLEAGTFTTERHTIPDENRLVSALQIFHNEKINDLYNKAEMERTDKRRSSRPNVFFGRDKRYLIRFHLFGRDWTLLDMKVRTIHWNAIVLVLWIFAPLVVLYFVMRRQLRKV